MSDSKKTVSVTHIDYSHMEGGLVRMMDRFKKEGTLTGEVDADDVLRESPAAALLGLLYDQRMRAEFAFTGPIRLKERLGHLDFPQIAEMDLERLREVFAEQPAVHRFTNKMAEYTQGVARLVTEKYDGDPARMWNDGADFPTIEKRMRELPGFGRQKAAKMKYVLHYFGHRDFSGA
ncbi:MAG: hypothetical protein WD021_02625 [Rhodothermales bacterium]